MVPERDRVCAGGEEAVCQLGGDSDPIRDVLAVDDAECDVELRPQGGQPILECLATGAADDVADEEDVEAQGSDPAAGCTSIATLFPRPRACCASA